MSERENARTEEYFKAQNSRLAKKIKSVLDNSRHYELFPNKDVKHASYKDSAGSQHVALSVATAEALQSDHSEMRGYKTAAKRLSPPIYHLDDSPSKYASQATSIFGIVPTDVLAGDGKYYSLRSSQYYFGQKGDGFKVEMTVCWNDIWGKDTADFIEFQSSLGIFFQQVEFVPHKGSREVDLDFGDYEKLGGILKAIKSGELTEQG